VNGAATVLWVSKSLDTRVYEKGVKVTKAEMKRLNICGDAFHPEWNYSVIPRKPKS
jgi:Rhodopirellula transposase DDE domain